MKTSLATLRLRPPRLAYLGLLSLSLLALDLPAATPLSFSEAMQEAERANPEWSQIKSEFEILRLEGKKTQADYYPNLSAELSGQKSPRSNQTPTGIVTDESVVYSSSLVLKHSLFSGLSTRWQLQKSESQGLEKLEDITLLKARLSQELKQSFALLLQAQKNLKLTRDIIKRRQDNLALVELRFASGRENKGAVLLSEANLKQARFEEMQAINSLSSVRSRLNKLLGRGDDMSYEVKDDVPLKDPPPQTDFEKILSSHPSLKKARFAAEAASKDISLAKSQYYPDLALSANYGHKGTEFYPQTEAWSVGLTLSVPIFSGGRDYYQTEAAQQKLITLRWQEEQKKRETLQTMRESLASYQEAFEKLKVDRSFETAASLRAEIARSKYNNGLSSFDDWDLIENDLITRQKAVLSSLSQRMQAEANWEKAQGKGVWP